MNAKDRAEYIERFFEERCKPLLISKGREYSGDDDALANFKIIGLVIWWMLDQAQGKPGPNFGIGVAWGAYTLKHLMSILTWFATGKEGSEPIDGRFADLVNYGLLGAALRHDLETQR